MSRPVDTKASKAQPATYRVTLGYDGAQFHGYAIQPDVTTVERVLRRALRPFAGDRKLALAVGGRTDRGVHAVRQVVSFKLPRSMPTAELFLALNRCHPGLWIDEVRAVPKWFHAHFCARARHYVYLAPDDGSACPIRMQRQLDALAGRRCFYAFARDTPGGQPTLRRLSVATVRPVTFNGQSRLRFDFCADAFLRRMVRVLVSTTLATGRHDAPPDALVRLAERRDRRATGWPAPPEHLYLASVDYDPRPVHRGVDRH